LFEEIPPDYRLKLEANTKKAMEFKMESCFRPHMRAFHLSWTSFLIAFTAWFAFVPLGPSVKESLNLTKSEMLKARLYSVGSTIGARILIGPIMDMYGVRIGQAGLLAFAAIPTLCAGFIQDFTDFLIVRSLIGVVGATFVGCQFWCMTMFHDNVVGSVNAISGGWGNLGTGLARAVMLTVYWTNLSIPGCDKECAWRNAFWVPALALLIAAYCVYFHGDDSPQGRKWKKITDRQTSSMILIDTISNPQSWLLFLQYAACFGVELHVNASISEYFYERFGASLGVATLIGVAFSLTNLFARALGGIFSDYFYRINGFKGRRLLQIGLTVGEGFLLIIFSLIDIFPVAVCFLLIFSIFVQAAEGSTFGIVPHVDRRHSGAVSGIVGAGGNVGAVLCSLLTVAVGSNSEAYFYIGFIVFGIGLLGYFIDVPDPVRQKRLPRRGGKATGEWRRRDDVVSVPSISKDNKIACQDVEEMRVRNESTSVPARRI